MHKGFIRYIISLNVLFYDLQLTFRAYKIQCTVHTHLYCTITARFNREVNSGFVSSFILIGSSMLIGLKTPHGESLDVTTSQHKTPSFLDSILSSDPFNSQLYHPNEVIMHERQSVHPSHCLPVALILCIQTVVSFVPPAGISDLAFTYLPKGRDHESDGPPVAH